MSQNNKTVADFIFGNAKKIYIQNQDEKAQQQAEALEEFLDRPRTVEVDINQMKARQQAWKNNE